MFPLIDVNGSRVVNATSLDTEYSYWNGSDIPSAFVDMEGEATQLNTSGYYHLAINATEANKDFLLIAVKSSEGLTQNILVNTVLKEKADSIEGYVDDLETRFTADRAGYLDNLNVTGTLAHSDDAATYKATGFSTHSAADVLNVDVSGYSGAGYAGTYLKTLYDEKGNWLTATGFSTHSAADVANVNISAYSGVGYLGTYLKNLYDNQGDWATATGFSTHSAANVVTAMQAVAGDFKATGFSTHAAGDVWSVATRALTDKTDFSLSSAGITAIWDKDVSAYTGAKAGTYLKNLYDNQSNWLTATGFSTHSAADVWAVATRALTELDEDNTTIDLDSTTVSASASISESDMNSIVDKVWEEAIVDHSGTAGSTAEKLNAAGAAGDPWTTELPGSYTAGQAGNLIGKINDATDGDKESGVYTGVEKMIKINR
ncbi:MAG: hypothetical protein M0P69_04400 [Bacteroidales bacterium]|nr:hypothetical protein [Bacteroidales bacterium]